MTRRDWLRLLLAAPIAATVDVEKLLWIPKPQIVVPVRYGLFNPYADLARQYRDGKMSIRFIEQWNVNHDLMVHRFDVEMLVPQPEFAMRVTT